MRARLVFTLSLGCVAVVFGACREPAPSTQVPPVTTAAVDASTPLSSGPVADASPANETAGPIDAGAPNELPLQARFVTLPGHVELGGCKRPILFAIVRGTIDIGSQRMQPGDVLDAQHAQPFDATGQGLALLVTDARHPGVSCVNPEAGVNWLDWGGHFGHANAVRKLEWAGGKMRVYPDYSNPPPGVRNSDIEAYLGRLEAGAEVPEHTHDGSWEILAVTQAAGVLTVDGKPTRPKAQDIVVIPPGTKHSWKPDPGGKLLAIQIYSPPGPERRFYEPAAPVDVAAEYRKILNRTIAAHRGEVQECYERARNQHSPQLSGTVSISGTVTASGVVWGASVASDLHASVGTGPTILSQCVRERFQNWTFPPPPPGASDQISYRFKFP